MEQLFIWSLQASLILSVLYSSYLLLFRKENRYIIKRVVLVSILLFSVIFPITEIEIGSLPEEPTLLNNAFIFNRAENQQRPIDQNVGIYQELKSKDSVSTVEVLSTLYILGVTISLLIFLFEIYKLVSCVKGTHGQIFNQRVIFHKSIKSPCSFLTWIFLPKDSKYDLDTWQIIEQHESAHLRQGHSLDLIFSSLIKVVCWYNPFIYWLIKSMKLNHEALADEEVLKTLDYKTYTQTLLNISLNQSFSQLSHSLALKSSLSNRILSMKTQKINTSKTFVSILTLFLISVIIFSQTSVLAQKNSPKSNPIFKNGTLFFITDMDGITFSSIEIKEKTGKIADGWLKDHKASLYTPILLSEERKDIIRDIAKQQDNPAFLSQAVLQLSPTLAAEELMKSPQFDFNMIKHTTTALSTEELIAMYELAKNWFNNYVKSVYPDAELVSETEFLQNKYLIIFSPDYSKYPSNSSARTAELNEVDELPSPKGGLSRFISNVLEKASANTDLSTLDQDIVFSLIVGRNGSVSHLELTSEVTGDNQIQEKKYVALGEINKQILSMSELFGWNSAIKDGLPIASKYRLEISKKEF